MKTLILLFSLGLLGLGVGGAVAQEQDQPVVVRVEDQSSGGLETILPTGAVGGGLLGLAVWFLRRHLQLGQESVDKLLRAHELRLNEQREAHRENMSAFAELHREQLERVIDQQRHEQRAVSASFAAIGAQVTALTASQEREIGILTGLDKQTERLGQAVDKLAAVLDTPPDRSAARDEAKAKLR